MLNQENRYLFKFAWKSIRRNAGRSFFIGFSVALAVSIAVWVVAFFDGLNLQIERAVVNTNTGYFQLQDPLYAKSTDSSAPMEFGQELRLHLSQLPIEAFSPELVLDGNISTPEGAAALLVLGVEPDLHQRLLPIKQNIIQGRFIAPEDNDGVIIGQQLALQFKFRPGDQLVLNFQDVAGELKSELLTIKGIYQYNSKSFEKRFIYVNQNTWQSLFLNEISGKTLFNRIILITPEGLGNTPVLRDSFEGSGLQFKNWKNLNPEMAVVLDFHDGMIRFFFMIIAITITMTILTPVQMLWQERLKELRMMNIIGISASKFWKIGIFEVLQMVFVSGLMSSALLVVVIGIQSRTGIDFRFLNDGVAIERAGIKLPGIVYPHLTTQQLMIIFVFVVFVLSVSYIWSIHRTLGKLKAEL
jgi:ABC-type lipoprotein release transport system permease subunit